MAQIRKHILIPAVALVLGLPAAGGPAHKFYPDDPISAEPKPLPVENVAKQNIDVTYDFLSQSFHPKQRPPSPAGAINTLGEVPDSAWFTNRHARHRLTREQLQAGPGVDQKPESPFILIGAKTDGITPGFRMKDARGRVYFVKPDPVSNPEMATAADAIGARFFYAIGYETPQNYIVNLRAEEVRFSPDAKVTGLNGKPRQIGRRDLDKILQNVPYRADGSVRVVASLGVEGSPIGPFRYEGARTDDPNDLTPHENRRDLRGLRVFCAWLNHTDAKGQNSLDTLVERNGVRFIQHYLLDFGSALGSDSDMPKNARFGNEFIFPTGKQALAKMFSLGLFPAQWERSKYPHMRAVGRLEARDFRPELWKSNYPNPAFLSALPDDEYWAAKIVMSFTDDDIRAIVEMGQFSDPAVVDYIAKTLVERRNKIGRYYFHQVLALDNFTVSGGELRYKDLQAEYGFEPARRVEVTWSRFANDSGAHTPIPGGEGFRLPADVTAAPSGNFFSARIADAAHARQTVTVYLRTQPAGAEVVGIDRTW